MAAKYKTVYLPSVIDPVRIREGIIEIINLVENTDNKK